MIPFGDLGVAVAFPIAIAARRATQLARHRRRTIVGAMAEPDAGEEADLGWKTKSLAADYDYLALDGSEIRRLVQLSRAPTWPTFVGPGLSLS